MRIKIILGILAQLCHWTLSVKLVVKENIINDSGQGKNHNHTASLNQALTGTYPPQFFSQLISHDGTKEFQQRYFVNSDWYKTGGPAFLYISGEQSAGSHSVSRGLIVELAKEHGGIIYALEHRYYGISQPFETLTVENLKHLSSENGLFDLRRFAKQVLNPVTNKANDEWYAIGGSYAGTLSAWARQAFPDVFQGALASSAPVKAKEDFFEYDQSISETLGPKCSSKLEQVVELLDNSYSENRTLFSMVKNDLGCEKVEDDVLFLATIYDTISAIVQYNSPQANPNVASLCKNIETATNVDEILYNLVITLKLYFKNSGSGCFALSGLADMTNLRPSEFKILRQWTFQCCTEFGFWQTTPKLNSMRSKFLTVDWFNKFYCSSAFYGKDIGPPQTDIINNQHQGLDINTNNTIFTNGDRDPWSKLSLKASQSQGDRPVLIIKEGSHVTDLGVPSSKDSESLIETRTKIMSTFRAWIKKTTDSTP